MNERLIKQLAKNAEKEKIEMPLFSMAALGALVN